MQAKFLALKVSTIANMGAYLSTFAPCIPTYLYGTLLAGTYTTPAIYVETKAVFTHTVPVDAYRGAGRPEATFLLERIVDLAADEIGMDPAELRRRNFIPKDAYPYQTPVALQYDSGDYGATLELALKAADYQGFEARRREAMARGKLRGIGIATYIEACGIAPSAVVGSLGARAGLFESAAVRVHPTGSVTVLTGSHSHGQGHETTFSQLVADGLGIPIESVEIVHGDTDKIPYGMGTYGSRSLAVGGSAIVKAMDKVVAKGRKIAAHLLEAAEADVEFKDGKFTVAGTDRSKTLGEVALTAYVPHNFPHEELEPGLDETAFYDPKNFTFPSGAHIAEVEIDLETGQVAVVNFTASDDFGRIINPMIVAGQVHGGLAQGIGQALLEGCIYDKQSGQLVTGSYNGLRDAARRRFARLRAVDQHHAVHPQSARRERVRRGRGDRRAGSNHQCARRRLEAPRRAASRHARHTREALAPNPAAPHPARRGIGRAPMYEFNYHQPTSLEDVARLLGADEEAKIVAGGMTLVPTLKFRLAKPSDLVDLAAIPSLRGITDAGDALVIGAMTRHAEVQRSPLVKQGDPGARGARRHDRRPRGAQPRHDWRIDQQQRPGGGLPGRSRRPRRHGADDQASDRGR